MTDLTINRVIQGGKKAPVGLGITLFLQNRGNPDLRQDERNKLPDTVSDIYAVVESLNEAQRLHAAYIEFYNLGGGNIPMIKVYDNAGNHLANISSNGRIWDAKTEEEIIL